MPYSYFFEPGDAEKPLLLLLHGTGGDEMQLVEFAREASPGSGILALRGTVNENGKLRFFKRLAEGVLDEDDIRAKASEVEAFVEALIPPDTGHEVVAIGYSNGANLAAALMISETRLFRTAILVRAVAPFAQCDIPILGGRRVLILSGQRDTVISASETKRLATELAAAGATVDALMLDADHEFGPADVEASRVYLRSCTCR